jgi:hypothetical protein
MLIAIPLVIAGCLLHDRAREEELFEAQVEQERRVEHAT